MAQCGQCRVNENTCTEDRKSAYGKNRLTYAKARVCEINIHSDSLQAITYHISIHPYHMQYM